MSDIRPQPDKHGVPWCNDRCPSHDGKRCDLLGCRPDAVCVPAVRQMAVEEALRQSPPLQRAYAILAIAFEEIAALGLWPYDEVGIPIHRLKDGSFEGINFSPASHEDYWKEHRPLRENGE